MAKERKAIIAPTHLLLTVRGALKQGFPPCSLPGTQKPIANILQHTIHLFCHSDVFFGITLIHSHQMALVVLAVGTLLFDSLREKRSAPLTK